MNGAAGDTEACTPFPQPSPAWSAHRYAGFGWGELHANMTALEWKFFRSKDGVLEDRWSKHKPKSPLSGASLQTDDGLVLLPPWKPTTGSLA